MAASSDFAFIPYREEHVTNGDKVRTSKSAHMPKLDHAEAISGGRNGKAGHFIMQVGPSQLMDMV